MANGKLNIKARRTLRLEAFKMASARTPAEQHLTAVADEIYKQLLPFVAQEVYQEAQPGDIYQGGRRA